MTKDDAIPAFLRLTPEERRAAWEGRDLTKPVPRAYEQTETERAYYQSIADDKAKQRIKDEARWKALREKKAAEEAEKAAVWSKKS